MACVDLSAFDNGWYSPERSFLVQTLWFFLGSPIVRSKLNASSSLKAIILKIFGARIGRAPVLKPGLRVKYPWHLSMGDHCWIGEDTWIDNLTPVTLGNHVCISQGAYLCTGNHNWRDPSFALMVNPIKLMDGSWVGAKCLIGPGVTLGLAAIATAGSVVTRDIGEYEIHAGNPATFVRKREFAANAVVA